ncbi:MAG TPA: MFS transporter, partial [Candidatus Acidoferrales bacterium]|nr:MFS transporter [Candidatus Acidoferrales bacterium]
MATQVTRSGIARPTGVRHLVVVYAVALAVITYIDRVCISQAATAIRHDLGLGPVEMGAVFTAFGWAYALCEIPGGYLGDRYGPRNVLMRIVLWWSFFTAATGWAWNFASLVTTRFLFGAGEAGCFPNLTKAFTTWLPGRERVRAQGIMWLSARWGGAFTPPLVALVMKYVGWRHAFEIFGAIGVVWAVLFYRWYRNDPRENPHLNDGERELLSHAAENATGHGDVPWAKFALSQQVWMICLQYFCLSYGWYFYVTWLPTYFSEARHLDVTHVAFFSVAPLFFGGIANPISVFVATR